MATPPTVLYPLSLPALLHHVLTGQSATVPTTLIVCSGRDTFLQDLVGAYQLQESHAREKILQLAAPTLHNLFTARHVKITFCASVQTLLACLTARNRAVSEEAGASEREASERIVLVNPLSLHAATSSFSAQGLSRTFAAAVETSLRLHATLMVAECQGEWMQPTDEAEGEEEALEKEPRASTEEDPWEQEVSILNVSAKKFGGDRAWAGRTVKVKRIAARWFRFRRLDNLE
ncbi:hypothetical protein N0V90_003835 [Kalmusia sp. IMI 367209]|nr:hypothetical protein N0V90_003835 [Kalmusia sp. IMI 367209]